MTMSFESNRELSIAMENDELLECPRGGYFSGVFEVVEELSFSERDEVAAHVSYGLSENWVSGFRVRTEDNDEEDWYVLLDSERQVGLVKVDYTIDTWDNCHNLCRA